MYTAKKPSAEFLIALDKFKRATEDLSIVWERGAECDVFGDTYPDCLPDFTEFNFQVQTMDLTPTAVRMRLREEPVEPLPQSIFISQKRGTEPA